MKCFSFKRLLGLLAALTLLWSSACGEVVITISDSSGSSSMMQNSETFSPAAPADTAQPAPTDGDAPPADDSAADPSDTADTANSADTGASGGDPEARQAFIDGIIDLARQEFNATAGKAQEAQYSSSIFICKNFTVYLFRSNADKYRMAAYPEAALKIPDNKPKDECKEYVYGVEWKDIPAEEGNPFIVAAQFRYDPSLSKDENREAARAFLMQAKRGDYFQMSANYYYGVGAHSMIFIEDYDPETDTVHWTDSNMKGEKRNGVRYAYVQYNAEKKIDWFVDAFCRKKYGATLYRLRDDIILAK